MDFISKLVPENIKATLLLRLFGLTKIPMMLYVRPSVVEFSSEKTVIKIPLRRKTQNHLKSMYFGALAIGADSAGGFAAMNFIRNSPEKISLVFKDFNAEFLKRAEGDVYFSCDQGLAIKELVDTAAKSDERQEMILNITATTPDRTGDEPVAKFTLTLSLKKRSESQS